MTFIKNEEPSKKTDEKDHKYRRFLSQVRIFKYYKSN